MYKLFPHKDARWKVLKGSASRVYNNSFPQRWCLERNLVDANKLQQVRGKWGLG